jgi:hypothetical protein
LLFASFGPSQAQQPNEAKRGGMTPLAHAKRALSGFSAAGAG